MNIVDYYHPKNTLFNRSIDDLVDYFSTFLGRIHIHRKNKNKNRLNRLSRREKHEKPLKNRLKNRLKPPHQQEWENRLIYEIGDDIK